MGNASRCSQEHTVRIQGCLRHDSAIPLSLKEKDAAFSSPFLDTINLQIYLLFSCDLLRILDQQGSYKVFGNLGHITEIFIVKLVLASGDVCVRLLLVLAQKRRGAT